MHTILIIDDNDTSRILLKEVIGNNKTIFIECSDGKNAIHLFQTYINEIDLVLLDIRLPGYNGWEVVKIIKQEKPTLPVIAISAMHPVELSNRYKLAGFDNFITKPISVKEVRELIMSYLSFIISLLMLSKA